MLEIEVVPRRRLSLKPFRVNVGPWVMLYVETVPPVH